MMPVKFIQFLSMCQAYVEAWESEAETFTTPELETTMRRSAQDRQLRYEGWIIGFMDALEVDWHPFHQEIAMRMVRQSFKVEEKKIVD